MPGDVKCPRCGSTQFQVVKRGLTLGRGLLGAGDNMRVCAKCGHQHHLGGLGDSWNAYQAEVDKLRQVSPKTYTAMQVIGGVFLVGMIGWITISWMTHHPNVDAHLHFDITGRQPYICATPELADSMYLGTQEQSLELEDSGRECIAENGMMVNILGRSGDCYKVKVVRGDIWTGRVGWVRDYAVVMKADEAEFLSKHPDLDRHL